MAEVWGRETSKWTKITNEAEDRTVDILTDTAGVDRLAVSCCEKSDTNHYNGTVTTAPIQVPVVAGNQIQTLVIRNPRSNSSTEILMVSFDGGTEYFDLYRGQHLIWSFTDDITQIDIKGNTATVDYQIIINTEAP